MSCFQAQVNASNAGIPELAIAVLLFIIAASLTFAAKDAAKKREKVMNSLAGAAERR
jgi:hypothetical protein